MTEYTWSLLKPVATCDEARRTARAGVIVPGWLALTYALAVMLIITTGSDTYGAAGATALVADLVALVLALALVRQVWVRQGLWSAVLAMAWFLLELAYKARDIAAGAPPVSGGFALIFLAIFAVGVLGLTATWRLRRLRRLSPDARVFD